MSNLTYSNFRKELVIADYPMGRDKRGEARYYVESKKGQERVCRVTTCEGRRSQPKTCTYARRVAIADGSDGRTYLLHYGENSTMISVLKSNMQHQHEVIHRSGETERFDELHAALMDFEAAGVVTL